MLFIFRTVFINHLTEKNFRQLTVICNIASIIVCDFIMNRSSLSCFFLGSVHWQQTGEHITVSVISCVLSSIFALSAVLGNGTIMLVIWKTRELHSPSFTLLFCLAVSDLFVGLFGQPSFVAFKIAELKENFNAYCNSRMTQFFFGWITCGVSFITLSGVCIDRLLALTLHLRYKTIVTVPRVIKVVIVVWVLCSAWTFSKFWFGDKWIILPALIALVTILITAFCTFKIFKIARKHQREIHEQNHATFVSNSCAVDALKCKKSAVTVLYIYGLLLILYLPFLAVMVVEAISGVTRSVKVAYDLTTAVVFMNSSVNPIIYCWRLKQVRRAVKHYLKRLMMFGQN